MNAILFGSVLLIALILLLTGMVVIARAFLLPDIAVTLTVNGRKKITSRTGQKLLTALTENGVLIPSACAEVGTCGLCRVQIPEGGPESLEGTDTLSR